MSEWREHLQIKTQYYEKQREKITEQNLSFKMFPWKLLVCAHTWFWQHVLSVVLNYHAIFSSPSQWQCKLLPSLRTFVLCTLTFTYLSSSAKLLNQFEQSLAGRVFEKRIFRFVWIKFGWSPQIIWGKPKMGKLKEIKIDMLQFLLWSIIMICRFRTGWNWLWIRIMWLIRVTWLLVDLFQWASTVRIRIMWLIGVTCLLVDCCVSELALLESG